MSSNGKPFVAFQDNPPLGDGQLQPVFILGDHRSGTTLLYQLLARTMCFNVVTAYHILCYDQMIANYERGTEAQAQQQIADLFAARGLTDRLIDEVKLTPDLPEEYGFLLRNAGFRAELNSQNYPTFVELCRRIQYVSAPGKPLLLKNPWDYMNFTFIKTRLPEAKFIFVHRNPINVINSQLRATRSLLQEKNEYVAMIARWYAQLFNQPLRLRLSRALFKSPLGLRLVIRHVGQAGDYFLRHINTLATSDYVIVNYEDLCKDPNLIITSILDFLQLPEEAVNGYEKMTRPRAGQLLNEVQRNRQLIAKRVASYAHFCGYDLDEIQG